MPYFFCGIGTLLNLYLIKIDLIDIDESNKGYVSQNKTFIDIFLTIKAIIYTSQYSHDNALIVQNI